MLSDLTSWFGEGWCVTLAPLAAGEVLQRMGVDAPAELHDGLGRVTERLEAGSRDGVLLLARQAVAGWALVLELEGSTGWVGLRPEVLTELSESGTTASACKDPNRLSVHFAQAGALMSQLNAVTGLRLGEFSDELGAALTAAGFPPGDDGEHVGEAARLNYSRRALLALQAATGVEVTDAMVEGPWIGGVSAL